MFAVLLFASSVASTSLFSQYVSQYGRKYDSVLELTRAIECFETNQRTIDRLNSLGGARHGWNEFTDVCADEFKTRHNLVVTPEFLAARRPIAPFTAAQVANTTDSVDWRTKGAVSAIKDQARCGSCWAFSSTGNMEGQDFLATNNLKSLSEEELVACSHAGNAGCQGGLMDTAFKWVIANKGIDSESDYPYTSGTGTTAPCQNAKLSNVVAKFSSFNDLPNDEVQMRTWLSTNGPIAIAVDASNGWQTYKSGIVDKCKGTALDHGVLLVGYGTDATAGDFWIVKNSWGLSWGEQGYIRLQFGTNQCDLKAMPSSIKV